MKNIEILDDESVNRTFKNEKNDGTKMADHQLNLNINLGEIRYLGVPDIIVRIYRLIID